MVWVWTTQIENMNLGRLLEWVSWWNWGFGDEGKQDNTCQDWPCSWCEIDSLPMVYEGCGHQAGIPGLSIPIQQAEWIKEGLKRQWTREHRTWSWAVPGVFHGEEERECLSHLLSTSPWYYWGVGGPWKTTERRWPESSVRSVSPSAQWG